MWGGVGSVRINGIGSPNTWENDLIRPGDTAGPSATTNGSVLAATGFKIDDNTDLVVELPGRNFELTRNFQGNSQLANLGAFGQFKTGGWTASIDARVVPINLSQVNEPCAPLVDGGQQDPWQRAGLAVLVPSPIRDTIAFQNYLQYKPLVVWHTSGTDPGVAPPTTPFDQRRMFTPMGPSVLRLYADHEEFRHPDWLVYRDHSDRRTITLPVWRLVDPGGGTSIFFRGTTNRAANRFDADSEITEAELPFAVPGRLWRQIDEYGNSWAFEYGQFPTTTGATPRLTAVYLGGENKDNAKAVVTFDWEAIRGDGNWQLRMAQVFRPYQDAQGARQWTTTDIVEYVYQADVDARLQAHGLPAPLWLSPLPGSLVMVVKRSLLDAPLPVMAGSPDPSVYHVTCTLYRYTMAGLTSPSLQLKGAFSPAVIDTLTREQWRSDRLGQSLAQIGRDLLTDPQNPPGHIWDSEATAWGTMALGDRDIIERPDNSGQIFLWKRSEKWTAYYGHPRFNPAQPNDPIETPPSLAQIGEVATEYSRPGDGGHTMRERYNYPLADYNITDSKMVHRVAQTYAPQATLHGFTYWLRSNVTVVTESTRLTNATINDDETSDAVWHPVRRRTTRSEERDIFTISIEDKIDESNTSILWSTSAVPFTVAEMVEDIDRGEPAARRWVTLHLFDDHNRPVKTIDPGAFGIAYDPGPSAPDNPARLSDWEALVQLADPSRLGSIQTGAYADDFQPQNLAGIFAAMHAAAGNRDSSLTTMFTQDLPSTMRVAKQFAGSYPAESNTPPSAQPKLLNSSVYNAPLLANATFAAPNADRPDLPVSRETSRDGLDPQTPDPQQREKTVYSFEFRSRPTDPGTRAISSVSVQRQRESSAENGPANGPAWVTTQTWLDTLGRVTAKLHPENVAEAFDYQPGAWDLTGKAITSYQNGTIVNGVFTAGSDTLSAHHIYDVAGNILVETTADGVSTSYYFDLKSLSGPNDPPQLFAARVPHILSASPLVLAGPVRQEWYDAQRRVLVSGDYEAAQVTVNAAGVVTGFTTGAELSRHETDYLDSGLPREERSWQFRSDPLYPSILGSTPPVSPYRTAHVYNGEDHEVETVDAGNNKVLQTYDGQGRLIETRRGVANVPGAPAPALIESRYYDGETESRTSFGDGLLTLVRQYPDGPSAAGRGTRNWYDARNRLVMTAPVALDAAGAQTVVGPYGVKVLDNMDRPVLTASLRQGATIASDPASLDEATLVASSDATGIQKTLYSHRGLVYRTMTLADRGSSTTTGRWLVTDHWFDGMSRELAVTAANALSTKRSFDQLGRVVAEVQCVDPPVLGFTDATNIDKGYTLSRTDNTYLPQHTMLGLTTKTQRAHTDIPTTGSLPDGLAQATTVKTYVGYAYDAAGRPLGTVNYGTNTTDTDRFTSIGASAPALIGFGASSDLGTSWSGVPADAIVTRNVYDRRGLVEIVSRRLSPTAREDTRSFYDSLGRVFAVVDGYTESTGNPPITLNWNGSASGGRWSVAWSGTPATDQNRVTSKVYDALGHITLQTAHLRNGSSEQVQCTSSRYTWTTADAAGILGTPVPSNSLLYQIRYPGVSSGGEASSAQSDIVRMGYNALGEQTAIQDQNGSIRQFLRDGLGRMAADRVYQFGALDAESAGAPLAAFTLDKSVSQIVTKYDGWGRTDSLLSCKPAATSPYVPANNLAPETATASDSLVQNFVQYTYNDRGQVSALRQSADGPEGSQPAIAKRDTQFTYTTTPVPGTTDRAYERLTSITYPDQTTHLQMVCDGLVDSIIGRVSQLQIQDGSASAQTLARYARLGVGTFALTELLPATIGVQLDRTIDSTGARHTAQSGPGIYGGWDRFGRLCRNSWVNTTYPGTVLYPIWQEACTYDALSRKLSKDNTRPVYNYGAEDWRFGYDKLDRVTQADRGVTSGSTFSTASGSSKSWTLDELGNWAQVSTTVGTGTPTTEVREHAPNNEIKRIDGLYRFYDGCGNLLTITQDAAGTKPVFKAVYDAWNRLAHVEKQKAAGSWDTLDYSYNGLNWKVRERRQVAAVSNPPPGSPPAGDTLRYCFYSPQWQELLEVVAQTSAPNTATSIEEQFWGLRGTDDAVYRRLDATANGAYSDTEDSGYLQLTDSSFSVVAHVDANSGRVRQWMSYDAYGALKTLLPGDFDGSGLVEFSDLSSYGTKWSAHDLSADVDGNGTVDGDDYTQFYTDWQAENAGWTTGLPDPVRIGFGGYLRDPVSELLLARNRWYEPTAGRWVTRDPAGYVDGLDLYLYAKGNPLSLVDPTGLIGNDIDMNTRAEKNAEKAAERQAKERAKEEAEAAQREKRHRQFMEGRRKELEQGRITGRQFRMAYYNGVCQDNADLGQSRQADRVADDLQAYMVTQVAVTAAIAPLGGPLAKGVAKVGGAAFRAGVGLLGREGAEAAANDIALPIVNASFSPNVKAASNVLNATVDSVVNDVGKNPGVLRSVLSEAETRAANNGMMNANVGKGIERLTAERLESDSMHRGLFQHIGGPNNADFVGKGGAFGVQFEVTTYKAFGEHLARPYGQGLVPALYEMPVVSHIP